MTPVIISLPVSPRLNAPLGFYLTAATVGMLARLTGQNAVLAVNLLGARGHTTAEAEHYLSNAGAICGQARHWTDTEADWASILHEVVERGKTEGWLMTREASICQCDCGLLEYPADTPPDLDKRATGKVYERRADGLHCRHCGSGVTTNVTPSLYLTLPTVAPASVSPRWAESEVRTFAAEYAGRSVLISRRRRTGLTANYDGVTFQLDPDFALMLLPFALHWEGLAVTAIVTGNRTLKQAFLAAAVAHLLGLPTPGIVALPMVTFTSEASSATITADEACAAHGSQVIRTVLAMAMGNTPKEVKLPTRSLHLAATSLTVAKSAIDCGVISTGDETADVVSRSAALGKNKVETMLATVRRRQALSSDQTAVLQAICA